MTKYGSFGKRDIALLLPDQVGDVISFQANDEDEEIEKFVPLKPKIDPTKKVQRYRPGQKPVYIKDVNEATEDKSKDISVSQKNDIVDRRLARLSQSNKSTDNGNRRRVYEAQVIKNADENDIEKDANDDMNNDENDVNNDRIININQFDDNEILSRRDRALKRLAEIESKENISVSSKNESESEYETDTDEDDEEDEGEIQPLKPLFVPKHLRETIKAKEAEEELQALRKAKQIEEDNLKKKYTREILAESIKRIEEEKIVDKDDNDEEYGRPDDTDDPNDIIEYEQWKIRELTRLRRDTLLREQFELEKKEIERRRLLTEEERLLEDKKLGIGIFKEKEKVKWNFLQKYYHKGVFYMNEDALDENDVRKRSYAEPTLEDKINKEKLPTILQVKNFGKKGRTKYTHLVDQDTTDFQTNVKPIQPIIEKYMNKRSGIGDIDLAIQKKLKK